MISHRLRCVYIHVPKTGGHSIDTFFTKLGLVSEGCWHATAAVVKAHLGTPLYESYYSFATVRNPWCRFVSEYFWQASQCATQIQTPWGNKQISFEDFCRSDYLWYPRSEVSNGHLDDQAHFIYDSGDCLLVKRVIRFENLASDFKDVCQELGLQNVSLPMLNTTIHEPYWRYYSSELTELIGKRFARDIRLFGYRFGDP